MDQVLSASNCMKMSFFSTQMSKLSGNLFDPNFQTFPSGSD